MSDDTQQDPHSVRPEGFEIKSTPGIVPAMVPAMEGVHHGVMHPGASNAPGSDDQPRSVARTEDNARTEDDEKKSAGTARKAPAKAADAK
jgi:hypothetical protein